MRAKVDSCWENFSGATGVAERWFYVKMKTQLFFCASFVILNIGPAGFVQQVVIQLHCYVFMRKNICF